MTSHIDPVILNIYNMRAADLSPLAKLQRLKALAIEWNTKASDISALRRLARLHALAQIDLPKLRDSRRYRG